jgi:hypothetical protein
MSRKKLNFHELAKNDPNFHDVRARILLETAQELDRIEDAYEDKNDSRILGMIEAASTLRRMASNARRAHNKHQDVLRKQREASEAKSKAFGA